MGYSLNLVIFVGITFQSVIMGNREINTGQGIQSAITNLHAPIENKNSIGNKGNDSTYGPPVTRTTSVLPGK